MTPDVILVTDPDCPNVQQTRDHLVQAMESCGLAAEWQEWSREDPEAPEGLSRYGSPTVLVDGEDVQAEQGEVSGNCCRVYADGAGGLQGAPSVALIAEALRRAAESV